MSIFEIFAHSQPPTAVDAASLIREKNLTEGKSFDGLFKTLAGDFLASSQSAARKYSDKEFLKFLEIFATSTEELESGRRILFANGMYEVSMTSWKKNSWQTSLENNSPDAFGFS